jgi:putative protein-disulfide isomerase
MDSQSEIKNMDTLIYIGDPMCSWCFGFTSELEKVRTHFNDAKFVMVMGGLRAKGNESLDDLRSFLSEHWTDVEKMSGQKFNHGILKTGGFIYDTEPSCRAVTLVRRLFPEYEMEFFRRLQVSFYLDNQNPVSIDTYKSILTSMNLDTKIFEKTFYKDEAKDYANEDFDKAHALGVNGFPTLIAQINGKYYRITNGFSKATKIINILEDREFGK